MIVETNAPVIANRALHTTFVPNVMTENMTGSPGSFVKKTANLGARIINVTKLLDSVTADQDLKGINVTCVWLVCMEPIVTFSVH